MSSSPDLPFVKRGGQDQQAAIYNRIAVIERIEFLTGVDLREKSADYLRALDLELWTRWYSKEPANKEVDEEFCQRAKEVVLAMEDVEVTVDPVKFNKALQEHIEEHRKLRETYDDKYVEGDKPDVGEAEQGTGGVRANDTDGSDSAPGSAANA